MYEKWDERGLVQRENKRKIKKHLLVVLNHTPEFKTVFELVKGKNGFWVALPMFGDLDFILFNKGIKNKTSKQTVCKRLKEEYGAKIVFKFT